MCETENRFAKYKPNNARAKPRETCPADALTLNDVPQITAKGKYRDVIDGYLSTTSGLRDRREGTYKIESLPEADELVRACKFAIKNESRSEPTMKAIHRVRKDAKEIARGLRAAVDELETTRDYPEARRNAERKRRRLRADGGRVQETFGRAELRETDSKCNKIVRIESGEAVVCQNTAKYAVEAGGKVERRCGVHISDIEVLIE